MTSSYPPNANFNSPQTQDYFFDRGNLLTPNTSRIKLKNYVTPPRLIKGTNAVEYTVAFYDFSDGGGVLSGPFSAVGNRYWRSLAVDPSTPGYLLPAQLISSTSLGAPGGTFTGVHSVNAFGTMLIGVGSVDDKCLWKETSATDPTPVAITGAGTAGRPGASITGLYPIIFGGTSTAQVVVECLVGAKPKVITDAAGTVSGTLDNLWNPTWWAFQTSLPGNPIIHQSGTSLYNSMTYASAVTATPVAEASIGATMRGGGYGIGELTVASRYNPTPRLYFVHPKAHNASGMLAKGSETLGYVEHVSLEGRDLQRFDFITFPNGIYLAIPALGPNGLGILASDGKRVAFKDGYGEQELHFLEQAGAAQEINTLNWTDSTYATSVVSLEIRFGEISVLAKTTVTAGGTNNVSRWKYNWTTMAWNRVSVTIGSSDVILPGWRGSPVSSYTGFAQWADSGALYRQFLVTSNEAPFIIYRRAFGGGASTGNQYDAVTAGMGLLTAIYTSFADGLEGLPSVVEEISFGGDIWAGMTGATVTISQRNQWTSNDKVVNVGSVEISLQSAASTTNAPVTATFSNDADAPGNTWKRFGDNRSYFYNFQGEITPLVSSGSRYAPNVLPVFYKVITFLDRKVMTPDEIRIAQAKALQK